MNCIHVAFFNEFKCSALVVTFWPIGVLFGTLLNAIFSKKVFIDKKI